MADMLAAPDVPTIQKLVEQCSHYAKHGYTPGEPRLQGSHDDEAPSPSPSRSLSSNTLARSLTLTLTITLNIHRHYLPHPHPHPFLQPSSSACIDPDKAKKEKAALELKKFRESTRKRFEERLVRKAKRAGLPEDHFLKQGASPPTASEVQAMKAMPKEAAFAQWKSKHGQHCWAFHLEGGCARERTCAFLHADAAPEPSSEDPSGDWHG